MESYGFSFWTGLHCTMAAGPNYSYRRCVSPTATTYPGRVNTGREGPANVSHDRWDAGSCQWHRTAPHHRHVGRRHPRHLGCRGCRVGPGLVVRAVSPQSPQRLIPQRSCARRTCGHDPPDRPAHPRLRSANVCRPRREQHFPAWETSSFPGVVRRDPPGCPSVALGWVLHNLWTTLWTGLSRGGTDRW
jgi:hypothetical protein